jgi:hemolysin activation/secretion protein
MSLQRTFSLGLLLLAVIAPRAEAGVLPEDRSDILYHLFEGGGVRIEGPSLLVRKKVGRSLSFVGNYYVDMISSASIDVVTQASPYDEERTQWSLGMDYLRGNTTMSMSYTSSVESDFDAKTYSFGVSQDMFGDLTTLSLSYSYGDDVIGRSDDPNFERENKRQLYGIGLTQILTRNLITTVNFETITDEGFMNNPYRSVRYADSNNPIGYSYELELYPNTRTTTAVGLRARYYLPYRAAIQGEYRFFTDTWNIDANTFALSYVHPWHEWTFEAKYRWHDQTGAHFFRDLFARSEATNFRGRDKELSPLTSTTIKLHASYEFLSDGWGVIKKGTVNFSAQFMSIDYKEFRDLRGTEPVGQEPLYSLDANIYQIFFSFWY